MARRIFIRGYQRGGEYVDGYWRNLKDLERAIPKLASADNAAIQLPDGVEIHRARDDQGGGFIITGADKPPERVGSNYRDAARAALQRSAQHDNPRSLGGAKRFQTHVQAAKADRARKRREARGTDKPRRESKEPPKAHTRPLGIPEEAVPLRPNTILKPGDRLLRPFGKPLGPEETDRKQYNEYEVVAVKPGKVAIKSADGRGEHQWYIRSSKHLRGHWLIEKEGRPEPPPPKTDLPRGRAEILDDVRKLDDGESLTLPNGTQIKARQLQSSHAMPTLYIDGVKANKNEAPVKALYISYVVDKAMSRDEAKGRSKTPEPLPKPAGIPMVHNTGTGRAKVTLDGVEIGMLQKRTKRTPGVAGGRKGGTYEYWVAKDLEGRHVRFRGDNYELTREGNPELFTSQAQAAHQLQALRSDPVPRPPDPEPKPVPERYSKGDRVVSRAGMRGEVIKVLPAQSGDTKPLYRIRWENGSEGTLRDNNFTIDTEPVGPEPPDPTPPGGNQNRDDEQKTKRKIRKHKRDLKKLEEGRAELARQFSQVQPGNRTMVKRQLDSLDKKITKKQNMIAQQENLLQQVQETGKKPPTNSPGDGPDLPKSDVPKKQGPATSLTMSEGDVLILSTILHVDPPEAGSPSSTLMSKLVAAQAKEGPKKKLRLTLGERYEVVRLAKEAEQAALQIIRSEARGSRVEEIRQAWQSKYNMEKLHRRVERKLPKLGGGEVTPLIRNDLPTAKREEVRGLLDQALKVHSLRPGMHRLDIGKLDPRKYPTFEGVYFGGSDQLQVRDYARPTTFWHEMGHWLDSRHIDPQNRFGWASEKGTTKRGQRDLPAMHKLMQTLEQTPEYRSLVDQKRRSPSKHLRYLTQGREVFARAYAQYIATKTGHKRALADIEREANQRWRQSQWKHENFQPVVKAFDELMKELGWTP